MPALRYRCTWDDIAYVDSDYMAGWGAFEPGCQQTVDFDDDKLPKLAFEMKPDRDEFSVAYQWQQNGQPLGKDFVRSHVSLYRRPCRFGGCRTYFVAPCCGRRTLRLAVLPEGLRCGKCGRITWGSRREQPTQRLIRQANKVALKLGVDCWYEQPAKRPPHMRLETFERLLLQHKRNAAAINQRIAVRMAGSGLVARLSYLTRL